MLRSGNIPSLIQGVSQQPASLRLPTQLDLMENCYATAVEGLIRRPPTEFLAKISETPLDGMFTHTINRDTDERYHVLLNNQDVLVFTLDGVEKAVTGILTDSETTLLTDAAAITNGPAVLLAVDPGETEIDFDYTLVGASTTATLRFQWSVDGVSWNLASELGLSSVGAGSYTEVVSMSGSGMQTALYIRAIVSAWTAGSISVVATYRRNAYLASTAPKTDFVALTIADYTFIVNKTVTPALKADVTPTRNVEGLVFVRQGNYSSRYIVYIDGVIRADFTTSATVVGELATDFIAEELYDDLVAWAGAGYTFTRKGSTIHIVKATGTFILQTGDSQGGTSLYGFKDQTLLFTDLPTIAPDGFVIGIDANPDSLSGAYYLRATSNQAGETFGDVTWQETVAPGMQYIIDPATMPHALIRGAGGDFTFEEIEWTNRICGDDESNEEPSFIGSPILDVGFYKNRLGFFADEYFIFSETQEYFNFWRTTVTQILDTDPIDSRAIHTKVSILKHMIPFNTDLILFSDLTQFKIPGDVAFTPKLFRADPVSEFEGNMIAKPVNAGKSIYFVFNREEYAGLKNLYQTETIANVMDAEDITSHVPAYIPAGIFRIAHSTLEGVSAILTDGKPESIFIYKTAFTKDNRQVQAAWFEWPMGDETVKVLHAHFIESTLHLIIQRDDVVYQEKIVLQPSRMDAGSDYLTCLDRRITHLDTTPIYTVGTDTTEFWSLPYDLDEDFLVAAADGTLPVITGTDPNHASVTVEGDYSAADMWFGWPYTSRFRPSTIYVRKPTASGGTVIDEVSRLQLRRGYINYSNSGYFKVSVTPEGRAVSACIFTGRTAAGVVALGSGRFSFAILSKNDKVILEISSDSILPFRFTSMEWEGEYTKRSRG